MKQRAKKDDKSTTPYPIKNIHKMSKAGIAKAFGYKSPSTIDKWGCPRNDDGTFDLPAVIKWRIDEQVAKAAPMDGDILLGGGLSGSVGLERYRNAAADLKEMEFSKELGNVVDAETMDSILAGLGVLLRSMGEKLQRQCGEEARVILDETLDAYDKQLRRDMKGVSK